MSTPNTQRDFLKTLLLPKILEHQPTLKTLVIYSDGAASHLKSKYTLSHTMSLQEFFGINIHWCFFASYHGKGVVDGIGGTAKRVAHDFARVPGNRITNQSEFSTLVQKKMPETWVMTATGEDIDAFRERFEEKFSDPRSIKTSLSTMYSEALWLTYLR